MQVLSVRQLTKHFGPEPVLDGVTFDLYKGERVSLIGPNGCGKSTLLKIIAGQEDADGGELERHRSVTFGYLQQQPEFPKNRTLWQEAEAALAPLKQLARDAEQLAQRLAAAEDDQQRAKLGEQYDRLQHQLQDKDAYHLDHKIERVVTGLGFDEPAFEQPVTTLSGGQQNRLLLAKLLLEQPDVMLLDEPSNHLDIDATAWLEEFLVKSSSTLLIVSHDRYLLDKVTERTFELFDGTVDSYKGNFSAYWKQKAERVEVQRRTYENQQTEIAKLEDFIRRHHVGLKHAQAEDRRKKLQRIQRVPPPRDIRSPAMVFPKPSRCGDVALRVEHLTKAYDQPLFADLSFDVKRGERWGVMGDNGSGKTTLLRCVLQQVQPDDGNAVLGTGVRVGYFDQRLELLDPRTQAVDAVRPSHTEMFQSARRNLLARFGITGDMVFQAVGSLSGGEKNRVALARLAASDANFLLLDEPTNHLDLWARDALEQAIRTFEGTILFVSHDRYFINQIADHLLVHDDGTFRIVHGDYETYRRMFTARQAETQNADDNSKMAKQKSPAQPKQKASKRRFPYRKVGEIEAEIAELEAQKESLTLQLIAPDVVRDGARVKQVQVELGAIQQKLAGLYEHWEECIELN